MNAAAYVAPVSPNAGDLVRRRGALTCFSMNIMGEEVEIAMPLAGRHQLRNLALAIATAEELSKLGFAISPRQVAAGVRDTRWPGRFQLEPASGDGSRPEMVIDVAHNPAGAWALRAALSDYILPREEEEAAGGRKLIIVYGAMRDKAVREVGRILFPLAEKVVLTKAAGNPRAATIAELREAIGDCGTPLLEAGNVADALQLAIEHARPFGTSALLVVTGSIYVVGEAMQALQVQPEAAATGAAPIIYPKI